MGAGIFLQGFERLYWAGGLATPQVVEDNAVTGNGFGIYVSYDAGITLQRNMVEANAYDGIALEGSTACAVRQNTVRQNNTTGDALAASSAGIRCAADAWQNSLTGNTATGNGTADAWDKSGSSVGTVKNTWSQNSFGTALPRPLR
jgi:parallel beta-helix repeat protein